MDLEHRIAQQFAANIEHASQAATELADPIARASREIVESLLQGGKILSCGNGGSASLAQHFMAMMIHRFDRERPGLPAVALSSSSATLTSVADDLDCEHIFSTQVAALGHPGDILLAISATGKSANVIHAVETARERQMAVIALNGGDGGSLSHMLGERDTEIRVNGDSVARIQEVQLLILHCLCDLIDAQLLGN
jgi:D-sedoheptulose 7-phosphate isomerase